MRFNPCFCRTCSRTLYQDCDHLLFHRVSILVFVELALERHDVKGTPGPGVGFQSLFLWNLLTTSCDGWRSPRSLSSPESSKAMASRRRARAGGGAPFHSARWGRAKQDAHLLSLSPYYTIFYRELGGAHAPFLPPLGRANRRKMSYPERQSRTLLPGDRTSLGGCKWC